MGCAGAARFEAAVVLIFVHPNQTLLDNFASRGTGGWVCPSEQGSWAKLPCNSCPWGSRASQSRAAQLPVAAALTELGSCPMVSLASHPSVPRRVYCRALLALGLWWLAAVAQPSQLSTCSILTTASATQVGIFLASPSLYLQELQYSSPMQEPDSIQQLLWRKGNLQKIIIGSCFVTSNTPTLVLCIGPRCWVRAEQAKAICTHLATHQHESSSALTSRGSRHCIQSTSSLLFWKSPLGKHPPACQALPAGHPAEASWLVVWLGSGWDSLCLAQRTAEREDFISVW